MIDALNSDMPFNRFTIEQVAGDTLPSAAVDQSVATGFHRNGLKNREGGVKIEQFRFEEDGGPSEHDRKLSGWA